MVRLAAILFLIVLGVGVFALPFAHSLADRHAARAALVRAATSLQDAEARRTGLADRLAALRSQANEVELTARDEFRLILPGERFELLAGDHSATLVANHSPLDQSRRESAP